MGGGRLRWEGRCYLRRLLACVLGVMDGGWRMVEGLELELSLELGGDE